MRFVALACFTIAAAACGAPNAAPIVVADGHAPPSSTDPTSTTSTTSSTADVGRSEISLECVTEPVATASITPQVTRLFASVDANDDVFGNVSVSNQFASHGGVVEQVGAGRDFHTHARRVGASLSFTIDDPLGDDERDDEIALAIEKRAGDVAWRGSFVDDDDRRNVVCWDNRDIFGDYGGPGAGLPVHFDFTRDACLDANGEPALNPTPIEVVRETGFGECADLRDVALNGDDTSMPDLVGFNLVGAELDGATLFFANLTSAAIEGADLAGLQYGYATVSGDVDASTTLPDGCVVDRETNVASCSR
mgnify:CR=1 FL=1